MRILHLTPGTGSFYCGTCLRDNALVKALRGLGHDALLAPLYLPPQLDEEPAGPELPLFYGGVNAYLQQKSGLFRRTPRFVDRLFDSRSALKLAASRAGMTSAAELGDITVSTLRGEEGNQAKELERLVRWMAEECQPDVVCLSNALLVGMARAIRERTNAAVVCTLQGEDAYLDALPEADSRRAWELVGEGGQHCDAFISVSHYYGDLMQHRAGLPADRVHCVYNGILLEGYEPSPEPPRPRAVGYLARLHPDKGLGVLVDAFLLLHRESRFRDVRLHVAGTMTGSDGEYVAGLKQKLAAAGLEGLTQFQSDISRAEKVEFLRRLSVFSVPATYGESFGLYVIEALASGVPVVQPRHAAFPELIAATGGGRLCEPGDPASLSRELAVMLDDEQSARELGRHGREVVLRDFSDQAMAANALKVFETALARRRG